MVIKYRQNKEFYLNPIIQTTDDGYIMFKPDSKKKKEIYYFDKKHTDFMRKFLRNDGRRFELFSGDKEKPENGFSLFNPHLVLSGNQGFDFRTQKKYSSLITGNHSFVRVEDGNYLFRLQRNPIVLTDEDTLNFRLNNQRASNPRGDLVDFVNLLIMDRRLGNTVFSGDLFDNLSNSLLGGEIKNSGNDLEFNPDFALVDNRFAGQTFYRFN